MGNTISQKHGKNKEGSAVIGNIKWDPTGTVFSGGVKGIAGIDGIGTFYGKKTYLDNLDQLGATDKATPKQTLFDRTEESSAHAHLKLFNGSIFSIVMEKFKDIPEATFIVTIITPEIGALITLVGTLKGNKIRYRQAYQNSLI